MLEMSEHPLSSPSIPSIHAAKTLGDIGVQVRAMRRCQGLRIDDAASLCGVSVDLLSRLENGKGGVGTDKVLQVLAGLGLELFVAPKGHAGLRALTRQETHHG